MLQVVARINTYNGTGSLADFDYTFRILADTDLVVLVDAGAGYVLQTLNTHYTVSGVNDDAGGTVTFTAGNEPPSGTGNVVLFGATAQSQLTQLQEGGVAYQNLEQALDKLTMIVQELSARFNSPGLDDNDVVRWNAIARALISAVAFDLDYTPTTSGDWNSTPDNVGDALDELAARVKLGGL